MTLNVGCSGFHQMKVLTLLWIKVAMYSMVVMSNTAFSFYCLNEY